MRAHHPVPNAFEPTGRTLLRAREVAAMLAVTEATVWRWIAEDRLAVVRLGAKSTRFELAEVERFIAAGRGAAHGESRRFYPDGAA